MSYAIIRNTKYKRENLKGIFRHNERRNKNYSNDNIDKEKSYLNYSIKQPRYSYEKEFDRMREEYNLKGQIKTVSNIACEYIITSDKQFFETIGEEETKRYFETAYQFVTEYKNLGEQYIMSAKVHMNEETAFYQYMTSHNFELERGIQKEESGRVHMDLKEYKEITNFDETKKKLQNMKLKLPNVPDIADININRLSKQRDEKILEEIIKPKDNLINELYQDKLILQQELLTKSKMFEKAEKYQKERDKIMSDNANLHNEVEQIKAEYKEKEFDIKYKYKHKIKILEKENSHLHKIVDRFYETVEKFIEWVCKKFGLGESKELVRDFEKETNILINPEKQLKKEEREKEWDLEI